MVEDSAPLPGVLSDSLTGSEGTGCQALRGPSQDRGGPRGGEGYMEEGSHGQEVHGQELEVTSQC